MISDAVLEPEVLLENDSVLVLHKPAGLVVNRATSVKVATLQDWIERYLHNDTTWQADRAADTVFAERSGMVHRLDKDTSGVIIFAKRAPAMHHIMKQFKERSIEKTYVALVHGHLPTDEGIIRAPILRHPKFRERFTVGDAGRPSETYYKVKKEFSSINVEKLLKKNTVSEHPVRALEKELKVYEGGFSFVELSPKTGRTHQIRVHMQFLHHPLVGDERYTGRRRARLDALWCQRQFLHAASITFSLPDEGGEKRVSVGAPLAADLQDSLSLLTE